MTAAGDIITPDAGASSKTMARRTWRWLQPAMLIAAGGFVLYGMRPDNFALRVMTLIAVYAVASVGMNVLVGFTGAVSIMNAAFLGIGGYSWARLADGPGAIAALGAGIGISLCIALAVGVLVLRLERFYFAVGTLALGTLATLTMRKWNGVTGGDAGMIGVRAIGVPSASRIESVFIVAVLALALFSYIQESMRHSALGKSMLVCRHDQAAGAGLGISVRASRLAAFAFSAVTGSIAGALVVQLAGSAFPEQFDVGTSISLIVIPIVGGRGWRWAPIAGAIVVIGGPEYFRFLAEYRLVAYGVLVTGLALFAPGGLREIAHLLVTGFRRIRPGRVR